MSADHSSNYDDGVLSAADSLGLSSRVRSPGSTDTLRIFNHYIHRCLITLALVQLFLLFGSVYLAFAIRFPGQPVWAVSDPVTLPLKAIYFAAVVLLCVGATGLYQHQRKERLPLVIRMAVGFVAALLFLAVSFYVVPGLYLGRGVVAIALTISFVALTTLQIFCHSLLHRIMSPSRVIFYGAGRYAADLIDHLDSRDDYSSFTIVASVPAEDEPVCVNAGVKLVSSGELTEYASQGRIDEIVIAQDDRHAILPEHALMKSRIAGVVVSDASSFWERHTGCVRTETLSPSWIIFADGFRASLIKSAVKRLLDLVSAFVLIGVSWPIMLASALAIKIEDGWRAPVFFWQRRTGLAGAAYSMCKFRSMRESSEGSRGSQWTEVCDARITHVGGVLRKYHIDELPQLFNVFRGDMSMVGPRPEQPQIVGELTETIPYYWLRECVRPGLTGWAQLRFRYGASVDDAMSKLQFDLYYVKNRSLFLDLLIILGTFEVVLSKSGSR